MHKVSAPRKILLAQYLRKTFPKIDHYSCPLKSKRFKLNQNLIHLQFRHTQSFAPRRVEEWMQFPCITTFKCFLKTINWAGICYWFQFVSFEAIPKALGKPSSFQPQPRSELTPDNIFGDINAALDKEQRRQWVKKAVSSTVLWSTLLKTGRLAWRGLHQDYERISNELHQKLRKHRGITKGEDQDNQETDLAFKHLTMNSA